MNKGTVNFGPYNLKLEVKYTNAVEIQYALWTAWEVKLTKKIVKMQYEPGTADKHQYSLGNLDMLRNLGSKHYNATLHADVCKIQCLCGKEGSDWL